MLGTTRIKETVCEAAVIGTDLGCPDDSEAFKLLVVCVRRRAAFALVSIPLRCAQLKRNNHIHSCTDKRICVLIMTSEKRNTPEGSLESL